MWGGGAAAEHGQTQAFAERVRHGRMLGLRGPTVGVVSTRVHVGWLTPA